MSEHGCVWGGAVQGGLSGAGGGRTCEWGCPERADVLGGIDHAVQCGRWDVASSNAWVGQYVNAVAIDSWGELALGRA